jgi:hypothetical protein
MLKAFEEQGRAVAASPRSEDYPHELFNTATDVIRAAGVSTVDYDCLYTISWAMVGVGADARTDHRRHLRA